MSIVLRAQNIGKSYRQWGREWRRILSWFLPFIKPHAEHWVLKDVSFSVNAGEAIGVIGQNGAGKSTLLKLIVGTTYPTEGKVDLRGRVAAILELGMGFNHEMTGRENAIHSAGLMGYSQSEINARMPEIEAFAEIGEYFDKPLRTYSTGMQMRVAFSVATAFRPDVLIVDEALSVGDAYFQQKCFRRIREYIANGTTLLLVTHDLVAVLEVCSRAIYLSHGRMMVDGDPQAAVALYHADILKPSTKPHDEVAPHLVAANKEALRDIINERGNIITDDVTCTAVSIINENGQSITSLFTGHPATLSIRYKANRELADPHIGFKIHNRLGSVIFETNTFCMGKSIGRVDKDAEIEVQYKFPVDLAPGEYTITTGLANEGFDRCEFRERLSYLGNVYTFTVLPNSQSILWSGMININPNVNWTITPALEQVI